MATEAGRHSSTSNKLLLTVLVVLVFCVGCLVFLIVTTEKQLREIKRQHEELRGVIEEEIKQVQNQFQHLNKSQKDILQVNRTPRRPEAVKQPWGELKHGYVTRKPGEESWPRHGYKTQESEDPHGNGQFREKVIPFHSNGSPHEGEGDTEPEDILPVWFPRLHSDVIYGHEEDPQRVLHVHRGSHRGRCLFCCDGQMFHEKKHCKKCNATTRCFSGTRSTPSAKNRTVSCSCEDFCKTRVGHFIGTNKAGRCHHQSKTPRGTNFALLTETGDICTWRYASWMRSEARALYLLKSDGVVAVTQAGRYFIYSEVHVVIQHPLLTGTMAMMIRCGKDVRELAKCIYPRYHTHTTCSVGAVTDLKDGAEIFLAVYLPRGGSGTGVRGPPAYGAGAKWPPPYKIHTPRSAYFGIIKFK